MSVINKFIYDRLLKINENLDQFMAYLLNNYALDHSDIINTFYSAAIDENTGRLQSNIFTFKQLSSYLRFYLQERRLFQHVTSGASVSGTVNVTIPLDFTAYKTPYYKFNAIALYLNGELSEVTLGTGTVIDTLYTGRYIFYIPLNIEADPDLTTVLDSFTLENVYNAVLDGSTFDLNKFKKIYIPSLPMTITFNSSSYYSVALTRVPSIGSNVISIKLEDTSDDHHDIY